MKRDYRHITNLAELRLERLRIRAAYRTQEEQLKSDASLYVKQFTPAAFFKKLFNRNNAEKVDSTFNISGKLMSLVLPFLLNKTFFRGSGFITKFIVGLVSNKLGGKLDLDHVTGIVDKVKDWISSKGKKKSTEVDYGIPPYSETS